MNWPCPSAIWWWLLLHLIRLAFSFARPSVGNSIAARIAMMATTTSNSMSVKEASSRRVRRAFMG
jgi:hypothetical protein